MWSLTVLLVSFVTQGVVPSVNAGYTFEMLLIGYQNPSHRSSDGTLCERGDSDGHCDNAFKICFRHRDSPETSGCDIRKFQTEKILDDSDNLMFREGESIGGVRNPITVTGETWPGQQIEIKLSMYDLDGDDNGITDGSDLVTMFVIHPNVTASVNGLFSEQYNHTNHYSSLQLAFKLTCLPPHSGPDCSLNYDRSSTYSSHRVTPTSITSVMVSPSPDIVTVLRPSPEDQAPSIPLVTLAIICTGAGVLLAIIVVVVMLVILTIRKRNKEKIDDSAFRLPHDLDVTEKKKCEEHLYDTASSFRNSSISSPPVYTSPPPMYAAVNAIAQEDPDGMAMEKNISYARVDVGRNVAYGVVGQTSQHRPMMPLPGQ